MCVSLLESLGPVLPPYSSTYRTIKHRYVHRILSIKVLMSASQQKCKGQHTEVLLELLTVKYSFYGEF